MVYWLFLPLVLSTALPVYVYTINPRERSSRLFVFLMAGVALNVVALFVNATAVEQVAWWASLIHAWITFAISGLVFWFLSLDLVWHRGARPGWVQVYTNLVWFVNVASAVVVVIDHLQPAVPFFGTISYFPNAGFLYADGRWGLWPQVGRAVSYWGALGVLAGHFVQADRRRRITLLPVLVALLAMPVLGGLVWWRWGQVFPGIDTVADWGLLLALGWATARHLFAPVEMTLYHIIDSMTDGLVVLNTMGNVLRVSKVAEQVLHVSQQRVLYQSYTTLFDTWRARMVDQGGLDAFLQKWQADLERVHCAEFQLGHDLEHRHISLCIRPIFYQERMFGYALLFAEMTTVRHREEQLERALAEQRKLAATMAELSSPILRVMEHTIVLPLVGTIDATRANLIAAVLFEGAQAYRAQVAILDLTGVLRLSADAATVLWESINGVQLLGTQPVLVGVQPPVAETLGGLDFDLRSLAVYTDLEVGLKYARQMLG